MMEELDLDRVINDPAYRRGVIERLNASETADQGSAQRGQDSAAALDEARPSD